MAVVRSLTTEEAAAYLGIRPETLRCWRKEDRGPVYVKHDGATGGIRYRVKDLDEWEESHLVRPASP